MIYILMRLPLQIIIIILILWYTQKQKYFSLENSNHLFLQFGRFQSREVTGSSNQLVRTVNCGVARPKHETKWYVKSLFWTSPRVNWILNIFKECFYKFSFRFDDFLVSFRLEQWRERASCPRFGMLRKKACLDMFTEFQDLVSIGLKSLCFCNITIILKAI